MSATIIRDSIAIPTTESQPTSSKLTTQIEIEFAKCDCCGLTEEYTPAYIARVRERFQGQWVCGLCAEAVKDETLKPGRIISTEEALNRHMNFCKNFISSGPPPDSTAHLISAVRQILRRSFGFSEVGGE